MDIDMTNAFHRISLSPIRATDSATAATAAAAAAVDPPYQGRFRLHSIIQQTARQQLDIDLGRSDGAVFAGLARWTCVVLTPTRWSHPVNTVHLDDMTLPFLVLQEMRKHCKEGFNQAPVDKDSSKYLGILTPLGMLQYTVLPQGFKNSPAWFQYLLSTVIFGAGCILEIIGPVQFFSFGRGVLLVASAVKVEKASRI